MDSQSGSPKSSSLIGMRLSGRLFPDFEVHPSLHPSPLLDSADYPLPISLDLPPARTKLESLLIVELAACSLESAVFAADSNRRRLAFAGPARVTARKQGIEISMVLAMYL